MPLQHIDVTLYSPRPIIPTFCAFYSDNPGLRGQSKGDIPDSILEQQDHANPKDSCAQRYISSKVTFEVPTANHQGLIF